jgi:hypothetical protein
MLDSSLVAAMGQDHFSMAATTTNEPHYSRGLLAACNVAFVVVGMMGAWSFHCFLADPSFAQHLYQYSEDNAHAKPDYPKLWQNVLNLITLTRLLSNTLSQSINLVPQVRRSSLLMRIYGGILLMVGVMLMPIFIVVGNADELTAFALLLTAVGLSGIATGFQQSQIFSLAAFYPHYGFSVSALLGMAVAAAAASVAKVITKVSYGNSFADQRHESNVFFAIGASWSVVAAGALWFFTRSPVGAENRDAIRGRATTAGDGYSVDSGMLPPPRLNDYEDSLDNAPALLEDGTPSSTTKSPLWRVMQCAWTVLIGNCILHASNFTIFPGVLVLVDNKDPWFKINVILAYNVALTLGRGSSHFVLKLAPGGFLESAKFVIAASILRAAVFIPLFVIVLPHHPDRKTAAYILASAFQLTGGLLSGFIAAAIPKAVDRAVPKSDKATRSVSGTIFSLTILLSCTIGTLINLAICNWGFGK